ncbi:MAG: phosphoglycerate dehydrogenase [Polyangiaceae bacterium]
MRVLVADRLPETSLLEIRALGVDVDYQPDLTPEQLVESLPGHGVLIVRGTRVSAEAIEAAPTLNLIVRAGAGTGNIDVAAASARGVYVANTPGKNASAVAELAFTLMGALDRRVVDATISLRDGKWEKEEYAQAVGLRGKRLGIVGFGHVGRRVAELGRAYGMRVRVWSRSLTRAKAQALEIEYAQSPEELAKQSDIFSIHLELNERTRGLIGRSVLEALPRGSMLINTAQDGLIDSESLLEIAPKKGLRLGLDVLPDEPGVRTASYDHPVLRSSLCYATPHIGASTDEAQTAIADECVRVLRAFLIEGRVPNVINVCASSPARYQLIIRHLDKVGVLANTLSVLKRHGLNVEELDNTVFDGARAGCARIRVDSRPSDACLAEITAFTGDVLHVDVVTLPNLA